MTHVFLEQLSVSKQESDFHFEFTINLKFIKVSRSRPREIKYNDRMEKPKRGTHSNRLNCKSLNPIYLFFD